MHNDLAGSVARSERVGDDRCMTSGMVVGGLLLDDVVSTGACLYESASIKHARAQAA
jgi:hypothetical protein